MLEESAGGGDESAGLAEEGVDGELGSDFGSFGGVGTEPVSGVGDSVAIPAAAGDGAAVGVKVALEPEEEGGELATAGAGEGKGVTGNAGGAFGSVGLGEDGLVDFAGAAGVFEALEIGAAMKLCRFAVGGDDPEGAFCGADADLLADEVFNPGGTAVVEVVFAFGDDGFIAHMHTDGGDGGGEGGAVGSAGHVVGGFNEGGGRGVFGGPGGADGEGEGSKGGEGEETKEGGSNERPVRAWSRAARLHHAV